MLKMYWKHLKLCSGQEDASGEEEKNKHRIYQQKEAVSLSPHLNSYFSLSPTCSPISLHYKISPVELMRASQSILDQINWFKVVLDAVGKERPAIYQKVFKKILQAQVEEVLKQIGRKADMHIEGHEQDKEHIQETEKNQQMEETDTEVDDANSDDEAGINLNKLMMTALWMMIERMSTGVRSVRMMKMMRMMRMMKMI